MTVFEMMAKIETQEDLSTFVHCLKMDWVENKDTWENQSLESYLDSLSA